MAMLLQAPQASGVTSPQTILPAGKVDSATRGFLQLLVGKTIGRAAGLCRRCKVIVGTPPEHGECPTTQFDVQVSEFCRKHSRACVLSWCSALPVFSVTQSLTGPVELLMTELSDLLHIDFSLGCYIIHRFVKFDTWISQVVNGRVERRKAI